MGFLSSFFFIFINLGLVIVSIDIVRKYIYYILNTNQFSETDNIEEKEEITAKASDNISKVQLYLLLIFLFKQSISLELFLNIIIIICGIISNYLISNIFLIFLFGYNLYSRNKRNIGNMIIDDKKENINTISQIGLEYKIKFVFYFLILIITIWISVFPTTGEY